MMGPRILEVGKTGEDVAELQRHLAALGYDPGEVDGLYGFLTEEAVQALQRDYGLRVDGRVGREVKEILITARERRRYTHVVQAGEDLAGIAQAYAVAPQALLANNRLDGGRRTLYPGRRLVIPERPLFALWRPPVSREERARELARLQGVGPLTAVILYGWLLAAGGALLSREERKGRLGEEGVPSRSPWQAFSGVREALRAQGRQVWFGLEVTLLPAGREGTRLMRSLGLLSRLGYTGLVLRPRGLRGRERGALTHFVCLLARACQERSLLFWVDLPAKSGDNLWDEATWAYDLRRLGTVAQGVILDLGELKGETAIPAADGETSTEAALRFAGREVKRWKLMPAIPAYRSQGETRCLVTAWEWRRWCQEVLRQRLGGLAFWPCEGMMAKYPPLCRESFRVAGDRLAADEAKHAATGETCRESHVS